MAQSLSREEMQALAKKLSRLEGTLSEDERALLLGIFGIAGNALADAAAEDERGARRAIEGIRRAESAELAHEGELPSLAEGFLLAFEPRATGTFTFPDAGPVSDSIGVGVACVSWSKDYNQVAELRDVDIPDDIRRDGPR